MTILPDAGAVTEHASTLETIEALAFADLLRAAPPDWRCVAEASADGWLLHAPALDVLVFNRILGVGLDRQASADGLCGLVARLVASGLENYGVQVTPAAGPPTLVAALTDAGLAPRDRWTKFWRSAADLPSPPPADVRVAPAGAGEAEVFGSVAANGLGMPAVVRPWLVSTVGMPGWHHYLAWRGAEPAGAGTLFVHGKVGWLGMGCTLPAHRKCGIHAALIVHRLEAGRSLGCRRFVSETGEDTPERSNGSSRNMLRAGFHVAYHRRNFMLPKVP